MSWRAGVRRSGPPGTDEVGQMVRVDVATLGGVCTASTFDHVTSALRTAAGEAATTTGQEGGGTGPCGWAEGLWGVTGRDQL